VKRRRTKGNKRQASLGGASDNLTLNLAARPLPLPRKLVFGVIACVVLPLLLLALLEIALHLAGYGYPTTFFKPLRIGNENCLVENDKFGLRFFPPELARSPAPVVMKAQKPAGTYRIFLFGESAALGDPKPAYGAGRYLQALLRERYPGVQFEVICVAITAINSHAVLPIARECARHRGDLWIIYMGNNEMVGPFGASTIFGAQSPPLSSIRLSLAIQRTRVGQLLMALGRRLASGSKTGPAWGGMKMFTQNQLAPRDHRKERVYEDFQQNLADILRAGHEANVPMILNTVAVNLKDCAPFASLSATNLPTSARDQLWTEATEAENRNEFEQAARKYEQASHVDPYHAGLQFRLGCSFLRLTNPPAALEHFVLARDFDALPFRADSRINSIITDVGRHADKGVTFYDAAALFAHDSSAKIPGCEWFYEHVHFNFDGNYRLGRAWAEQIESLLPASRTNGPSPNWASQETCEHALGLTDWNRFAVLEDMLGRFRQAPFTNQLNHEQQSEMFRTRLRELRTRMDPPAAAQARGIYLAALKQAPDDHRLHENFAEFLTETGDLPQAVTEWRRVHELIPHHHVAWFEEGQLLRRQGKLAEAQPLLLHALSLRPDLAEGWLELGNIYALEGKTGLALRAYERERKLAPGDSRIYYHIGKALSKLGHSTEAIQSLHQATHLNPTFWEAHYALGEELGVAGKITEARKELEEAIRLKPDYSPAHLNLGVALVQLGKLDEALREFEETLRLDPQNKLAADYFDQVRARSRRK
jgi:tetratricopeptide (TPR) repeat protein